MSPSSSESDPDGSLKRACENGELLPREQTLPKEPGSGPLVPLGSGRPRGWARGGFGEESRGRPRWLEPQLR